MNFKREKIPLKIRIIVGVVMAILVGGGNGLWDYYSGEELHYWRYVFQGVVFALLMSWMFRYKVVKEKK